LDPPEALSGGERTALALAYRLALGHVVRSFGELTLSTLILDEPTDGFSPEQVGRMGELLDELRLPQVILVSHEAGLASIADHVVRIRKEGGESIIEADPTAARARPHRTAPDAASPATAPSPKPRRGRRTLEEAAPPTP
jgi:DNA repair exonuclease SbcCD ATPase subunit